MKGAVHSESSGDCQERGEQTSPPILNETLGETALKPRCARRVRHKYSLGFFEYLVAICLLLLCSLERRRKEPGILFFVACEEKQHLDAIVQIIRLYPLIHCSKARTSSPPHSFLVLVRIEDRDNLSVILVV